MVFEECVLVAHGSVAGIVVVNGLRGSPRGKWRCPKDEEDPFSVSKDLPSVSRAVSQLDRKTQAADAATASRIEIAEPMCLPMGRYGDLPAIVALMDVKNPAGRLAVQTGAGKYAILRPNLGGGEYPLSAFHQVQGKSGEVAS